MHECVTDFVFRLNGWYFGVGLMYGWISICLKMETGNRINCAYIITEQERWIKWTMSLDAIKCNHKKCKTRAECTL